MVKPMSRTIAALKDCIKPMIIIGFGLLAAKGLAALFN